MYTHTHTRTTYIHTHTHIMTRKNWKKLRALMILPWWTCSLPPADFWGVAASFGRWLSTDEWQSPTDTWRQLACSHTSSSPPAKQTHLMCGPLASHTTHSIHSAAFFFFFSFVRPCSFMFPAWQCDLTYSCSQFSKATLLIHVPSLTRRPCYFMFSV